MKAKHLFGALALALASNYAAADIDKILPASKYDVKVERNQRIAGDAHLQGQVDHLGGKVSDLKGRTSGLETRTTTLETRADANDLRNDSQDAHINAVQGAAQAANEKADAGAVRMDGIEGSLANTDDRSINNAVRLDGVEGVNAAQDVRLDKTNQRVDAVAWTTNSNTTRIGKVEGRTTNLEARADDTDLALINHGNQLENHSGQLATHNTRLDGHDQQFADQDVIKAAVGSSLAGLYQDTAALSGKVQEAHNEARAARREAKEAKNFGAIALAVAGHQFNTEPSAGFQMALSASTIGSVQGYALGAGGAVSDQLFFNVGIATSGSQTGGVVSGTYTFGR